MRPMSIFLLLLFLLPSGWAESSSPIFPAPKEIKLLGGVLAINESTRVLLPSSPSKHDLFLARLLMAELSDRYFVPVAMRKSDELPRDGSFVLMGTIRNPLVAKFLQENGSMKPEALGREGYVLRVSENAAVVAANTDVGVFYGFQSLRQLFGKDGDEVNLPQVIVRDEPAMPFRGIRMYVPGRENIPFFKRFIKDFMALYKFNEIMLEMNGVMRLDRHPEINVGAMEFANEMNYSRRNRPAGPGGKYQDSAHHDAGDGKTLEKEEVADLVEYIRRFHIEVIPEIPSLTHSYYLLARHRELAEIQDAEWPDSYCPSNPQSYELLFDVYDEYIDVIHPRMVHVGKDEWRMEVNVCPRCKGKDYRELFVQDVTRIYHYLKSRGVKMGFWGDHLLENVRGKGFRTWKDRNGEYHIPGAITPEQVRNEIPKDILIFNWFYGDPRNDRALQEFGFRQVYGNMRPNISNWEERRQWASVLGGAPSSWAATTEFNFGKDLLYDFLGCANLLWTGKSMSFADLTERVRSLVPTVRSYLSGRAMPSQDDNRILPVDLSAYLNVAADKKILDVKLEGLKSGRVSDFVIPDPQRLDNLVAVGVGTDEGTTGLPNRVAEIRIGQDVSSMIFLHACAKEAGNEKAYRMIYNFEDTADLLGWYEVVYEDGFVETIPIRYGVNILDVGVRQRVTDPWKEGRTGSPQNIYAYLADPVECSRDESSTKTFFAYEWRNPRFGKVIKSIRLLASQAYRNYKGEVIPPNAIFLLGLSYVEKRPVPEVAKL